MSNAYLEKLFSLRGQTAVVIGGTGVLGGALCEGLAQAGAFVVVAGNGADRGNARVEAIRKLGGEAAFLPADVTSRQSLEELLAATVQLAARSIFWSTAPASTRPRIISTWTTITGGACWTSI